MNESDDYFAPAHAASAARMHLALAGVAATIAAAAGVIAIQASMLNAETAAGRARCAKELAATRGALAALRAELASDADIRAEAERFGLAQRAAAAALADLSAELNEHERVLNARRDGKAGDAADLAPPPEPVREDEAMLDK